MTCVYDKNNPFLAHIKERRNLCKEGSQKNTYHVVLDLEGSGITYQVGDSIAVHPINDSAIVNKMLGLLQCSYDTIVHDKHTKEPIALQEFLLRKANLASVPKKLILELANRQTDAVKQERLQFLLQETQKELLKEYQAAHEVWDTLAENEEVLLGAEELCHMLQPLLPRFYSIASSMKTVGNEVHLLIADVNYTTNSYQRYGVCTDYLCRRAPLLDASIPVYIQSAHDFTLPDFDDLPIIMIGPGTGVAPFRAFMQEREARKANGSNWLFFGEWHREQQFFYEDEWNDWVLEGRLRLDTAFSRDQEHKVYVQHKMLEYGKHLFDLLEKGALLYVCGDAHRMAKDVDAALNLIVRSQGNLDEAGAKQYMKKLKAEKRYLRDVY
jgi:sulfite reductase (NADPH) flavoprotein alpha-component